MIKAIYSNGTNVFTETNIDNIHNIFYEKKPKIFWLDITAEYYEMTNEEIALLTECFRFHELSIEDCLFPQYQPKLEEFESYVFAAVHGILMNDKVITEIDDKIFELDIFIGKDFVITVHADDLPLIETIYEKAKIKPQVLLKSHEYLLYSIFDKVYATYEFVMDKLNSRINEIEDKLLNDPSQEITTEIFSMKKTLLSLRRIIDPQQNVYSYFTREGTGFVSKKFTAYFRDLLYDYKRLSQMTESYNQLVSGALEVYVSSVTLKLNEVIKFLTVIATVFLPALLITSYYGMNVVPFLEHRILGNDQVWYFAVFMIIVATFGIYYYLRKKKWL